MNASRSAIGAHSAEPMSPGERYRRVREASLAWCATLQPEDTVVQSMPDASPVKWHLAHTTWFFEQFLLARLRDYVPLHPQWRFLFNSYYQSVGPMHARAQRGMLSRPTLAEILDYRARVDEGMQSALTQRSGDPDFASLLELGLNHEQQHQELLLTDIKHLFSLNPLQPVFRERPGASRTAKEPVSLRFLQGHEGIAQIGHADEGFAFDNESPRHRVLLYAHALANRPVTNAEYRAFIEDGGYRNPLLWLSEGWDAVQREHWSRPLYWSEDLQSEITLAGAQPIEEEAPVCHVSFYEADAFARWAGARLPLESEWESAAQDQPVSGNFADRGALHPLAARSGDAPLQLFGDVWEWTSSPYVAYPGFKPANGAIGEYNGKFMCGQWVLRGGSCATPEGHVRASYRNFFHPAARWQFSGIRLAKDA